MSGDSTIDRWLDRLRRGDPSAVNELLRRIEDRVRTMVQQMLRRTPRLHRWMETDDVLQHVLVRLTRTLRALPIADAASFLRLAGQNVRWEVVQLARQCQRLDLNRQTPDPDDEARFDPRDALPEDDRENLARWAGFHEAVESLPAEEREVFTLVWYGGLSQTEVAELLDTSERTVRRRWQQARFLLLDQLGTELPE